MESLPYSSKAVSRLASTKSPPGRPQTAFLGLPASQANPLTLASVIRNLSWTKQKSNNNFLIVVESVYQY